MTIDQLINELHAAGFNACRASELQPEAIDGLHDGKFQTEGMKEMATDSEWEEVLGSKLEKLESREEQAKALATKVCGENYSQQQFGRAYEVIRQRALLQEAEAALREAAE